MFPDMDMYYTLVNNPDYSCNVENMEERYVKLALQLTNNQLESAFEMVQQLATRAEEFSELQERAVLLNRQRATRPATDKGFPSIDADDEVFDSEDFVEDGDCMLLLLYTPLPY